MNASIARLLVTMMFVAVAIVLGLALTSWAAPIVPQRPALEDQARSLASVTRLRLVVDRMPRELDAAGLRAEEIVQRWTKRLLEAGVEVGEDEEAATLRLKISTVTDSKLPGGVGFNPFLSLEQRVAVAGVNETLTLPTYLNIQLGLETTETLADTVNATLEAMLTNFLNNRFAAVTQARPDRNDE